MCGGDVELSPDKTYGICSYCGNSVKVSETREEQRANLKNIADNVAAASLERLIQNSNTYLELGDYSSAQEVFNRITKEYPEDYRGWWGLIVCETKGFEIIKKDQTNINKWFNNVKQLAHEKDFSIHRSEFEIYARKISNVDSENEIVKFNGIIDDLNKKIKEFNFNMAQIEQDKESQSDDYHNEIMIKDRDIRNINPLKRIKIIDKNGATRIFKPFNGNTKNKVLNFIRIFFGAILTLAAYSSFIESIGTEMRLDFSITMIIMGFIGSKIIFPFSVSILTVGTMLFFFKNETTLAFGIVITLFGSIATLISYIKSKKKKNAEAYEIKVKIENIERQKEEITNQYKNNINALDKQLNKIKNQISEIEIIIENCKKYLNYDKDKISDMFFALRCSNFGIKYQFDSEVEKLRKEILEANIDLSLESRGTNKQQVINSELTLTDVVNLIMTNSI